MTDALSMLTDAERERLRRRRPRASEPMLATLTEKRFSDPEWIYERKLDGERALAQRTGCDVELLTRNGKRINDTYPELADALGRQPAGDFVVDGEIVAFEGGVTSFSRLQRRMQITDAREARASRIAVRLYLFDILYLEGRALEELPLRRRKALLKRAFRFEDPLRYTAHRNRDGEAYLRQACDKGWEGIVAKRAGSPYRHRRSTDWLKFKCARGQELVVGGFTEPRGSRVGFGALLVGYYEGGKLRYAGKVGTGYDDDTLRRLRRRLDRLERKSSPFAEGDTEPGARWVRPSLVGEFGFTEWTVDGKLRHPRFLGLRRDKSPEAVVRERETDG